MPVVESYISANKVYLQSIVIELYKATERQDCTTQAPKIIEAIGNLEMAINILDAAISCETETATVEEVKTQEEEPLEFEDDDKHIPF